MKLEELNAKYLKYSLIDHSNEIMSAHGYDFAVHRTEEITEVVATLAECNGIEFLCPLCSTEGRKHVIRRWSHQRGASFFASPVRYRWKITGIDFTDICIVPDFENEMSIDREADICPWNGFVENGEVK